MDHRFSHQQYTVRRKFLKLFGAAFHIYDTNGNVVFFSKMKAFKLKEDIRVFTGEAMSHELFRIKARTMINVGATYDVVDPASGESIGALRHKRVTLLKDEWFFLDPHGSQIGRIREGSHLLALLRRLPASLLRKTYHGNIGGQRVCTFKQNFNLFVTKITLDLSADTGGLLDLRLGIATAIVLCATEAAQLH